MHHRLIVLAAAAGVAIAPAAAPAQGRGGMMGMPHDSASMAQMRVIHELVVDHASITRTVTNLPDGVRTQTESKDPRVAQLIKEHVVTMDHRVVTGDDPGFPMESPAVRAIFIGEDKIRTTTETTATGIVVVQTSTDSALVVALQQHAVEVTDLVNRGMNAMRDGMMRPSGKPK